MTFWLPKASSLRLRANKGLFLVGFFFCIAGSYGQRSSKVIEGKVVSPKKDVTGITIQNISTERATITDFEGNFSIRAGVGDTLVFSAVQFKRKVVPVSEALIHSPFVQIPMEEFVNELREVTVQPFGLSGDIGKDLTGLQLEKDVSAEALGLPNADVRIITQSERKLQEASKGMYSLRAPLAININPIINAITGRTKMLKNRVKLDKTYARTQNVQKNYADSIFQTDLKIPKIKVDDFMYFCEVDNEFQRLVALGDQLRIWEYLLKRSQLYRKNNGME
ncbi:MAG: carboxypeptidase-like regulatory domain-containing protein [Bacteroidota bacterium]